MKSKHPSSQLKSAPEVEATALLKDFKIDPNYSRPVGSAVTQTVLADAGIGVWCYNFSSQEISFDQNMFTLFGFDVSGTEITTGAWLDRISPIDRERTFKDFVESIQEKTPFDNQYRLALPGGVARVVRATGRIHLDAAGSTHLLGVCIDITKQVSDREKLKAQNLKEIAISKANALSRLSAGIAHEINNPLTIILGHAENLQTAAAQGLGLPADVAKGTLSILKSCQRISNTVRGLRNFARDGSDDPIQMESLTAIFEHVLALCRSRFQNREIDLQLEMPAGDLMAFCRSTEMEQALFYALSYAFDTTVGSPDRWVKVSTKEIVASIQISVTTSKQGVSEDVRRQIDDSLSALDFGGDGTLLGLSIAKGIVDSVRGQMFIDESSPFFRLIIEVPKGPPATSS